MPGATVAVAAGDDTGRDLLLRIVERAGHEPVPITVSADDLGAVASSVPGLALLDLDGEAPAVVAALRGHPDPIVASCRVVVLADGPAVGLRAWQAGADGFLARPFHHDRLIATLRDVLDRPEAGREPVRRAAATEYLGGRDAP
ncbi:MAG: hypothetical protein KF906_06150 [Actinobacteria bacterium]|nr:hypothetical protein [Actinomycetota bacterium]